MKSKKSKLIVLFIFVFLFIGSALFMYFKYIHKKPKIEIVAPRKDQFNQKLDSMLKLNENYNK